ncbi:MAG: hypothetical protein NVV68_18115 [Dokdonella sp.]|nr:hypothetical protein [Dokdonella sp.]
MMGRQRAFLAISFALSLSSAASAEPVNLFSRIVWNAVPFSPPLPDAIDTFWSTLDIQGLATKPEQIAVSIPRVRGDPVNVVVTLESMDRRNGFVQRDGWACDHGDPTGCEIIPVPNLLTISFPLRGWGKARAMTCA